MRNFRGDVRIGSCVAIFFCILCGCAGAWGSQQAVTTVSPASPPQIKIDLAADGMFDRMQSEIKPEFMNTLTQTSARVKAVIGEHSAVLVVGHTDSRLSKQYNLQLSEARAGKVADALVSGGIPRSLIQVIGKGEEEPIATNATAEGRQHNRRVEIFIIHPTLQSAVHSPFPPKETVRAYPASSENIAPLRASTQAAEAKSTGASASQAAADASPAVLQATRQAAISPASPTIKVMRYTLYFIVFLIGIYALRHYLFTLNRLFGRQRHPYTDIDTADWPSVTILIAAHNEEAVIAGALEAILDVDYPQDRLRIMPVNDRSTDRTEKIIDTICAQHGSRITPFHRRGGKAGKAAALKDAMAFVESAIIIVFDADYIPSRGLIKQLAAPFFDPDVGAVMGRVVPLNVGSNLLTRLLDLERSGGYQVDQQARMNLGLLPQYGGTVGGVRVAALNEVGGWHDDVLAEDTDLTYRLLLRDWKTVYQNRSECYEEVPETWPVRIKQIKRWAKGHNQAMFRHTLPLLRHPGLGLALRIDSLLLLGTYAMAPLLVAGWGLSIALYYLDTNPALNWIVASFALMSFSSLGNFAAFFEIAAAVRLDGNRQRTRLLPLNYLGFLVSLASITRATLEQTILDPIFKRGFQWDKTVRYRQVATS